jgi:hypothetical protein
MAKGAGKRPSARRRDRADEELERLRAIDRSGYAEIVIVTDLDDDEPTALIVNGVPHVEVEGRDVVAVLRKFADLLEASRSEVVS